MKDQEFASIDEQVGARIRARRLEIGLTVEYFSAALKVSGDRVEKWEAGLLRVGSEKLLESARILDIDPQGLFPDTGSDMLSGPPSDRGVIDSPSSSEIRKLLAAFSSIKDPSTRNSILELANTMAQQETGQSSRH